MVCSCAFEASSAPAVAVVDVDDGCSGAVFSVVLGASPVAPWATSNSDENWLAGPSSTGLTSSATGGDGEVAVVCRQGTVTRSFTASRAALTHRSMEKHINQPPQNSRGMPDMKWSIKALTF